MTTTVYFLGSTFPAEFTEATAVTGATVKLHDRDDSYIEDISAVWNLRVNADRDNACRRTADFSCAGEYLNALRVRGRRIKVGSSAEDLIFDGYIDAPRMQKTSDDRMVSVRCRDKMKRFLLAGFSEDTTYEDLTASDAQRVISSASATSNIGVGDEIQRFGVVYESRLFATILGIESEVNPAEVEASGDILAGDYSIDYSKAGLTQLRLKVSIDLRVLEAVTAAVITTNGSIVSGTTKTSQDGLTWSAYAGGSSFRYLQFEITKSAGPVTLGVSVTTSAAYSPSNVITDGIDSWRPAPTDLDRRITLDIGSAQNCNVLYLRWGISSLDRSTAFTYLVERSTDAATWTTVGTYTVNASYLAEHLFDSVSLRYIRITLLSATDGLFALRFADIRLTTSTVSIDTVIRDIAESEGETSFDFTPTRRYLPSGAITFEAGAKKWEAMDSLAKSIGFELFYSKDGILTLKPRDKYDLSDIPEFDDPIWLDAEWPDDEIYNQVIAIYESADLSLRSIAQDGDGASPTGIPNVGTRTAPIIRSPFADTQAKLDALALVELQKASKPRISVSFEDLADLTLEPGDVIRITDADISGLFVIESFALLFEADREIMTCEVTPL